MVIVFKGRCLCNPNLFFILTEKRNKKVRTAPALLCFFDVVKSKDVDKSCFFINLPVLFSGAAWLVQSYQGCVLTANQSTTGCTRGYYCENPSGILVYMLKQNSLSRPF
jgi:hypothetical protein